MLRIIRSKLYLVKASREIPSAIERSNFGSIRNYEKFMDIVMAFAVLRSKRREVVQEKVVDGMNVVTIVATEQDLQDAIKIYSKLAEGQATNEDELNLKILRFIASGNGEWVFLQDIANHVGYGQETVRTRPHWRLGKKGLLHRIKGLESHRMQDPREPAEKGKTRQAKKRT
jgi:hypothetical protein